MGTSGPWNWRLTGPKTIKMTLVRPPMTNVKMTVWADRAVSACTARLLSKLLPTGCQWCWWGVGLWTDVRHPPSELLLSEIKQSFLSINVACLSALERWAAGPHALSVTGLPKKPKSYPFYSQSMSSQELLTSTLLRKRSYSQITTRIFFFFLNVWFKTVEVYF